MILLFLMLKMMNSNDKITGTLVDVYLCTIDRDPFSTLPSENKFIYSKTHV